MAPLRAWAVAVDLDAVALGVVEVERRAAEMVRGAGQPPSGARRPRKGPGERGPPRDQDREVKQPRRSGRALGGPGARDELHHHRAVDAQPEGPLALVQRAQPDRALVELAHASEIGDAKAHGARHHRRLTREMVPGGLLGLASGALQSESSLLPRRARPGPLLTARSTASGRSPVGALVAGHLGANDRSRELRDQALEVIGHPLLLALDVAGELGGIAIGHALGERLDRRVRGDLLGLLGVLGLRVLQEPLVVAAAPKGVQGPLHRRSRLPRESLQQLGIAPELLDAMFDASRVILRLTQVLLEALLVGGAGRHPDMRLERRLELLLLAVRLVQVLHELAVTVSQSWHISPSGCELVSVGHKAHPYPPIRPNNWPLAAGRICHFVAFPGP